VGPSGDARWPHPAAPRLAHVVLHDRADHRDQHDQQLEVPRVELDGVAPARAVTPGSAFPSSCGSVGQKLSPMESLGLRRKCFDVAGYVETNSERLSACGSPGARAPCWIPRKALGKSGWGHTGDILWTIGLRIRTLRLRTVSILWTQEVKVSICAGQRLWKFCGLHVCSSPGVSRETGSSAPIT